MNKYSGIAKLITSIGPGLKAWIFSDGKFNIKRASILLLSFVVLIFSVEYFGAANTEIALSLLDSLSDIFGYSE